MILPDSLKSYYPSLFINTAVFRDYKPKRGVNVSGMDRIVTIDTADNVKDTAFRKQLHEIQMVYGLQAKCLPVLRMMILKPNSGI